MASELLSSKRRKVVGSKPFLIAYEPRSLNEIPDELLLKIFSHFGPEDLALIICKVCQRWNDVARDLALWNTLSYHCDESSDIRHIKEVLTVAPALHSLIVRDHKCVSRILKFLSHGCAYLRKLILENCYLGKGGTGLLANIVKSFPDLEGLSLEGCRKVKSAGYCHIARLEKLSELNLSYTKGLSGKTVRLIAESCQHLKKLRLQDAAQIDDDDILHVINKLGKQLTTLSFDGEHVTDVAYLYLKNCARLQELGFTCENMSDRGLLEGIGSLHELTSLHLFMGHNLTAEALSTFLHQPSMTSIVTLELYKCSSLRDEGLNGIAERCIHLEELAVNNCHNVTDAGISMVISNCNQLRLLNLMCMNSITGEGWMALVQSHLPNLSHLFLFGCKNLHGRYVEELLAAVPELEVIK